MKNRKVGGGKSVLIVLSLLEFGIIFSLTLKYDLLNKSLVRLGVVEGIPQVKGDYWCIKGWNNMLEKMRYHADVVFFGNSITCGSDFKKIFPNCNIVTLGYPGDNIEGMMNRICQIGYLSPNRIFIMAGINDLAEKRLPEDVISSYVNMVDSIRSENPNAKIFIQSILPVNHNLKSELPQSQSILKMNMLLQEMAKKRKNMFYIDLFSAYSDENGEMPKSLTLDGLHLKSESYMIWANIIRDNL